MIEVTRADKQGIWTPQQGAILVLVRRCLSLVPAQDSKGAGGASKEAGQPGQTSKRRK